MVDAKRFLHLEKDRPQRREPGTPARPELHERFREPAPEREQATAEPPTGMAQGRFQADDSSGLALDNSPHALSFQRCIQCGTDNSRFVSFCERCGGSLTTEEQRAHQVQLELEQTRARQAEEAELAQQREARATDTHRQDTVMHAAALELGRALANRERDRTEALLGADPYERGDRKQGPLAPRLLKQISNPRVRLAVMVGGIGVLLIPWFMHGPATFNLRFASVSLFIALFAPWRPRARGFWRDF